jgi:hypothetical protein
MRYPILMAIALFALIMSVIHVARPAAVYAPDGSFRRFGVGYADRTVTPIWAVVIVAAVLSFMAVKNSHWTGQ